jgi:hypothetical protein
MLRTDKVERIITQSPSTIVVAGIAPAGFFLETYSRSTWLRRNYGIEFGFRHDLCRPGKPGKPQGMGNHRPASPVIMPR